ncbi:hypothetical protein, partial [Microcoleus sp. OTE_8_concoct_300]|uniref:hypothetical protein n=1 Tax=Microcoleus sp. OTE_8_concoct_300 TaxID=2964710 RepID=UPI00403F5D63
ISHVVLVQLFPILNPLDCYNKAWLLLDNAFTVTLPQDRKRCQMGSIPVIRLVWDRSGGST